METISSVSATLEIIPPTPSSYLELELFLDDPAHDISSLQHHPTVNQVFVQNNASLTSSAQVETLFSMGGQILTPRRNKLTDEHFEMLLLFRVNKNPQL